MKRREFIAATAIAGLTACGQDKPPQASQSAPIYKWKMVTSWPKNFPVLGTAAEYLAELIRIMSAGRIAVKVYAAGELVPAFACFDAVSEGVAELAHSASYYWKGKNPAFQFFSTVPFGMNATQATAWLHEGDGLDLWREAYAAYGIIPMPAGNTGIQMGGWFNREIKQLSDFKGLKIRIPGLGGDVVSRVGATPVSLPGGDLLTSMQTGVIDAVEWVAPFPDLAFGLHKVARYYYYPGWQEPGVQCECMLSQRAFEKLPQDLQTVVYTASQVAGQMIRFDFINKNNQALLALQEQHGIILKEFPDEVLAALRVVANDVIEEIADHSELARRVYDSYMAFQRQTAAWQAMTEQVYYEMLPALSQ